MTKRTNIKIHSINFDYISEDIKKRYQDELLLNVVDKTKDCYLVWITI